MILGLLSGVVVIAFIIRSFPDQVAEMTGLDSGMLSEYSDHVMGFGIAAILLLNSQPSLDDINPPFEIPVA